MSSFNKSKLFQALSDRFNQPFIENGYSNVLATEDGREIWLETPEGSDQMMLHTQIINPSGDQLSMVELKRWLLFNLLINKTQQAYVGIHPENRTLRLCMHISMQNIDVESVDKALGMLIQLATDAQGLQQQLVA